MPDRMPGSRRVWLHDGSPARDVTGRDVVGGASEPAPLAAEHVPGRAVPLVNVATSRALARRASGIHQDDWHRGERRLVDDELPELPERPGVHVGALSLANRYPLADPTQVFELDPAPGAFGLADDSLADDLVDVPGEPGFPAAAPGQQPPGGLGAFRLQPLAELAVSVPHGPDRFPAVRSPIGVGGQVDNTEVHPEPLGRLRTLR